VRVYLDHNATTPLRPEVGEALARAGRDLFGNPSSPHAEGAAARAALESARASVAELLGCRPQEVIFTAGATEANNTALLGVCAADAGAPRAAVSTTVEHPSVEAPLAWLEARGARVARVAVDADGLVDEERLEQALAARPALFSLLWANNETGVLQPLERIAARARAHGVLVHVDATQRVGKLPIDLSRLPVDLLSLSAHKLNGPKGVGCLVVRGEVAFAPLLRGGPQEAGRRGGTENVAGAVGLGVACELARAELPERAEQAARLRDRLWQGLLSKVPRVRRNGSAEHVLPNTLNVEFEGASGELLLQALDLEGVAVSAGAACASGSIEPSHVLCAMGRSPAQARGSLRFSLGHGNSEAQIDHVLALLPQLVARARAAGEV
jgi:cysteine desulfurase